MLTQSQLKEFIELNANYVFDPEKWALDIIGFEADVWQKQAMKDFITKRFLAISAGSSVGKSAFLAVMILFFISTRPFPRIACTANSKNQLYNVLWAELSRWYSKSDILRAIFKLTKTRLHIRGDNALSAQWYATAMTARLVAGASSAAAEGLQGIHAEHILFVVDESSGVPNQVYHAVEGSLSTPGAHAIYTANPTRRTGFFYNIITDKKYRDDYAIHFVNAENAKYADKAYIERVKRIHGRNSDFYRVKVLGIPPKGEAKSLVTPEQMFDAHERTLTEEQESGLCTVGVDPARYGPDTSVLYVRRGLKVLAREEVSGMDGEQVAKIAIMLLKEHKATRIIVDEIGVGSSVIDNAKRLTEKYYNIDVVPVHVGSKPVHSIDYLNLRAQLFWNLRTFINVVSIPIETDLLDDELTQIEYKWNASDTRIQIESKDQIRDKLDRSCNDADAFALAFYDELIEENFIDSSPVFTLIGRRDPFEHIKPTDDIEKVEKEIESPSPFISISKPSSFDANFGLDSVVGANRYSQFRRN